ncbi:hypothetical protein PoB_001379700 [Plakobranchus ocellatus]|uniref:Uncharacterized protein n=1 Tax=Plakobranchus ocellatus TaxID=259542 RepID=A0AAV3YYK6_9GAST|nr:hypothetical protein PoB_001379700 [Plakobranchus ocellatus]
MKPALHEVTQSELPALQDWLGQFLPDSLKMYMTVRETLQGRWRGTTFYTLGWPNILAAGEGVPDSQQSDVSQWFSLIMRLRHIAI